MSAIRSKNTKPEIMVRKLLHHRGFRFRLHADLPGKPDIVLAKHSAVIWINGCFWHGHNCKFFRIPATRTEIWKKKIKKNRERDRRLILQIQDLGWRQAVIWECALKNGGADETVSKVAKWLRSHEKFFEIGSSNKDADDGSAGLDI